MYKESTMDTNYVKLKHIILKTFTCIFTHVAVKLTLQETHAGYLHQ